VGRPDHIGVRVRRLVHLFVVLTSAALLALPLLLGPATTVLVRALGGADEHHCACGMQPGKCGCPECAALEADKQADRESPHPFLRSSCDDGAQVPMASALPLAAPPGLAGIAPPRFAVGERRLASHDAPSRDRAPPEPPPPRRLG